MELVGEQLKKKSKNQDICRKRLALMQLRQLTLFCLL